MRVPWTARRSNQSILREISPGCSLEGLMLKLKCQYFGNSDVEKRVRQREGHTRKARGAEGMAELEDREELDQEFTSVGSDF